MRIQGIQYSLGSVIVLLAYVYGNNHSPLTYQSLK